MSKNFNHIANIVIFLMSFLAFPTSAVMPYQATPTEIAVLPRYCQVKYGAPVSAAEIQSLEAHFKREHWVHMHHYCDALRFIFRSDGLSDRSDSCFWLGKAEQTLAVEGWATEKKSPDWPLRAEAMTALGRVHLRMKKCRKDESAKAAALFARAIQVQPDYVAAYVELADFFENAKQNAKALETVTIGLRHVPENKQLRNRYARLGGTMPYPESLIPAPDIPSTIKPSSAPPMGETGKQSPVPQPSSSLSISEKKPAAQANDAIPTSEVKDKPSGSSQNPWCRFCP